MKQKVYIVQCEAYDEAGDIVENWDLLLSDSYEDALEYGKDSLLSYALESNEKVTVLEADEIDGEIDYEDAQLLWAN